MSSANEIVYLVGAGSDEPDFVTEDKGDGAGDWAAIGISAGPQVLFVSSSYLPAVVARLVQAGRPPATPVAIIEWGVAAQHTLVATLSDVVERARRDALSPRALMIVGDVVSIRERLARFERCPLRGRRILLLSTEPSCSGGHIRLDGAEVVSMRSLLVLPRPEEIKKALPRLASAHTLVLSSKHAVDALLGVLHDIGQDARALGGVRVAAVGRATAERLLGRGIKADLVGEAGGAELAEALLRVGVAEPVLHLRAAEGRPELATRLLASGVDAEVVAAYETAPDVASLGRAVRCHQVERFHAIGFTSPKGVESFVGTAGGPEALAGVLIGAVGVTTASALATLGLTAVTAATPDLAALEERLASGLAETLGIG